MFEEVLVCMTCGRPVDGQLYCSNECEALDQSLPSSSPGAGYPLPAQSSRNTAPAGSGVPDLTPSSRGRLLSRSSQRPHRPSLSISSSSGSSVVLSDDEDEAIINPPPCLGPHSRYTLAYTRRPSGTNHRSILPLSHKCNSSCVLNPPSSSSATIPCNGPTLCCTCEECVELSDMQPRSSCSSTPFRTASNTPIYSPTAFYELKRDNDGLSREQQLAITSIRKRKRTSLPTCFSLLQASPVSSSARSRGSLQTLTAISRSLHSAPSTSRVAHPMVEFTHVHGEVLPAQEKGGAPRGRDLRRGSDASGRRSTFRSPSRNSTQPVHLPQSSKPEPLPIRPSGNVSTQRPGTRRNSSPIARFRNASVGLTKAVDASVGAAVENAGADDLKERGRDVGAVRGRRRPEELDETPEGMEKHAPGFGSGRSGWKGRQHKHVIAVPGTVSHPVIRSK